MRLNKYENIQELLNSIKEFYGKHPIYAECGGMLILIFKVELCMSKLMEE